MPEYHTTIRTRHHPNEAPSLLTLLHGALRKTQARQSCCFVQLGLEFEMILYVCFFFINMIHIYKSKV